MKVKEIGIFLLVACIGLFSACSSDKDKDDPNFALAAVGVYKGDLSVVLAAGAPAIESKDVITVTSSKHNLVNLELKDFTIDIGGTAINAGDILLKDLKLGHHANGATILGESQIVELEMPKGSGTKMNVEIVTTGTLVDNKAVLNLDITKVPGFELIKVEFKGNKLKGDEKTEAKLTKLTFDSEHVLAQPVIKEGATDISLYIAEAAKPADLKALAFKFEASENATVTPDKTLDMSTGKATITVVSEDGKKTTVYTVKSVASAMNFFDMETWAEVNPGNGDNTFSEPTGGWSSTNSGVMFLKIFELADRFNVLQTEQADAYAGNSAARIETLDTKGKDLGLAIVPKVTSGSLFTGSFETDTQNTLNSTKFGVPYGKEPLLLGGYYKYKPGEVFYRSTVEAANVTVIEAGTTDKASINAILYDISTDEEYITGVDTYKDERIVATALFSAEGADTYTRFDAEFKYADGKTYDKSKTYRLAIIASSSSEGDTFSGAPGSVLFIDDLEIISK